MLGAAGLFEFDPPYDCLVYGTPALRAVRSITSSHAANCQEFNHFVFSLKIHPGNEAGRRRQEHHRAQRGPRVGRGPEVHQPDAGRSASGSDHPQRSARDPQTGHRLRRPHRGRLLQADPGLCG